MCMTGVSFTFNLHTTRWIIFERINIMQFFMIAWHYRCCRLQNVLWITRFSTHWYTWRVALPSNRPSSSLLCTHLRVCVPCARRTSFLKHIARSHFVFAHGLISTFQKRTHWVCATKSKSSLSSRLPAHNQSAVYACSFLSDPQLVAYV